MNGQTFLGSEVATILWVGVEKNCMSLFQFQHLCVTFLLTQRVICE